MLIELTHFFHFFYKSRPQNDNNKQRNTNKKFGQGFSVQHPIEF